MKENTAIWNTIVSAIRSLSSTESVIDKVIDLGYRTVTEERYTADIFFIPPKPSIKFVLPQGVIDQASDLEKYYNSIGNYMNVVLDQLQVNLFVAAKNSGIPVVSTFDNFSDLYVIRDFYYDDILSRMPEKEKENFLEVMVDRVFVVKDIPEKIGSQHIIRLGIIPSNPIHKLKEKEIIESLDNDHVITVLNGVLKQFAQKQYRKEKKILIDEIYPFIRNYSEDHADYLWKKFEKCMKIVKILQERGWQISSFVGRNLEHEKIWKEFYPFVQLTRFEKVDHGKYLELLRSNTFYFSHFLETYGLQYYEALQHGIPVIGFTEHLPLFIFQSMFNSVLFSSQVSDKLAADLIEDYYEKFDENLFNQIRQRANSLLAAEEFGTRLLKAFEDKEII